MAEPVDELLGELGVGVVVDRADDFLGVPGHAHLAFGVAGFEQAEQLGAAALVETFVGLGQQATAAVERVGLAAAMAERLVLHPAAHLVELGVGQLDEMERIGDLGGVGQHRVEHRPIRPGQIERRPLDRGPATRRCGRRTRRTARRCHDLATTSRS